MQVPIYQIDAFAGAVFGGNPAAVCPLDSWLPDGVLQSIAGENNLSETAFFIKSGNDYEIRWFTPASEIELCGHATIASGFVIFKFIEPAATRVKFKTRKAGDLAVARDGEWYILDFPSRPPRPARSPEGLAEALGRPPISVWEYKKLLAVFEDASIVESMRPDFNKIAGLEFDGVIVTAPGRDCDFVSRYFAPHLGINEDPATGSSHCLLTPFWADKLGKNALRARQVSRRGGELRCELSADRVKIAGRAAMYLEGFISI
ncbi:MAG: PhzF family phenazine biosynthesis protein [Planctomycetes bacterium]|nr:PhzF family phenazine biosynthesis protein [Planctomycetota bacterium]